MNVPTTRKRRRGRQSEQTFGQHLARIRRERGLTQTELAQMVGLDQTMVSNYERGILRLHGDLLAKLSRVLRVSTDDLLGLDAESSGSATDDRRFLRRLQKIDRLSKRDKLALLRTIDAFLGKAS